MSSFVKLRRGIIEHVKQRRLSEREYAAYTMMILCANHSNGHWRGSGTALACLFGYGARTGQRTIKALSSKGYIRLPSKIPAQGNYSIGIVKYFERASVQTGRASVVTVLTPKRASVVTPIQEVSLNLKKEKSVQEAMQDETLASAFRRFYDAYPLHRRYDEFTVQVEWVQLPMIERDVDAIVAGLEAWKKSDEWKEANGRFVPKAAKFLRERLWKHPPLEKPKEEDPIERQKRLGYR